MGVAGDMLFGALLELHPDPKEFLRRFNELGIPNVVAEAKKGEKCGISGTHVEILVDGVSEHEHHGHHHDHHHEGHHHHTMQDISNIIENLKIDGRVRKNVLKVYKLVAEAESEVHQKTVNEVHFHEVGMMDAIADITGVCMLFDELSPDRVVASPINTGFGQVKCAHGILPVPAPATAFILRGIPTYANDIEGELATPTGAALLKNFAAEFGSQPQMIVDGIGYGLGTKDFEAANVVRACIGTDSDSEDDIKHNAKKLLQSALKEEKLHPVPVKKGEVANIEKPIKLREDGSVGEKKDYLSSEFEDVIVEFRCCIDDMTAEEIGYATELLMDEGALDVYVTPIGMKKNRPGILLTVLARKEDELKFRDLIFKYTTTIGVRVNESRRYKLQRSEKAWDTPFGEIRVKESTGFGVRRRKLEYEDIKKIAESSGMSVGDIREIINGDGEEE